MFGQKQNTSAIAPVRVGVIQNLYWLIPRPGSKIGAVSQVTLPLALEASLRPFPVCAVRALHIYS